jgi:dTDP-glucose pyrophosphorylase
VLLGIEHVQHEKELLIANADQYLALGVDQFLAAARADGCDGSIMTFPNTHPRWSYVRTEGDHVVTVAEKVPISRNATVGLYYFRRAADFIRGAERMLLKNASLSGEFYVAPVFNELVLLGRRVTIFPIEASQMLGLGTPEEVERFRARRTALAA